MLSAREAAAKTQELYDRLKNRRPEIEAYDRYYEGKHPLKYASKEWAKFHQERYRGFSDNWCAVVVDALNERLKVQGLLVGGTEQSSEESLIWDDWRRNEMEAQSSQGFLQAICSTRSAVIIWADENDEPVATWEHPSQVFVEYGGEFTRRRTAALKSWVEGRREFATLFTPDAIYKFERPLAMEGAANGQTASGLYVNAASISSSSGGWVPREVSSDGAWPLNNPLNLVPVVEIQNRPRLRRGPISDIAGTMAMQDATNLLWAYLFSAADHASMPARVVMGQQPPKMPIFDDAGNKIGERAISNDDLQQKRLLWLTGEKASIGQYDSAKLDVFTDVIDVNINHIAAQSRTPAHYFIANKGMSNLNGETLKATETPLVKKAEEFQLYSSNSIADIFRIFALIRGFDGLASSIGASSVQWADVEIRSEAQRSDSLIKKRQMGYPQRYLLELDGHSPTEVERIMGMIQDEQRMDPLYAAQEAVRQGVPDEPSIPV